MKILCLDIEGGHGGSSRSLYHAIEGMDRSNLFIEVICKKHSSFVDKYAALNVRCNVFPELPRNTALNNWLANIPSLLKFYTIDFPRSQKARRQLLDKCRDFDVLHANHISLTPLVSWLSKKNPKLKISTHIRTMPKNSIFTRSEAKQCKKVSNALVFISENEKAHFEELVGHGVAGNIVYNSVDISEELLCNCNERLNKYTQEFRVLSLSNYSLSRGVDRLLQVAENLSESLRSRVVFVVAGDMRDNSILARLNPWKISFEERVKRSKVSDVFCFLGHVSDPYSLLVSSDVLMKLTRENNPWGRDIIEALAFGLPVVSVGSYDRYVKTGETGLLQERYNPKEISEWLQILFSDNAQMQRLSNNAKKLAKKVCCSKTYSDQLKAVWLGLVKP